MPAAPPQHQRAPLAAQHRTREHKAGKAPHPFAGRKGWAFAKRFKEWWFGKRGAGCAMCGKLVNGEGDQCHVDHIRPHDLRPDLAYDYSNLQVVCTRCHNGACQSIENRYKPDADRIAAEKAAQRGFNVDGWRL